MKKNLWGIFGAVLLLFANFAVVHAQQKTQPINISKIVKRCKACHGKDLKGKKKTPGIYGQNFSVLYIALTSDVPKKMEKVVKKLSNEEVWEVAHYISDLGREHDGSENEKE